MNSTEVRRRGKKDGLCVRDDLRCHLQVNALEHDALEVLSLVQSTKNSFAPVNRIPPDVLSLIPNYWEDSDRDEGLIMLTHVCHGWRELFISRSSLWTHLDCMRVDKTEVYIERSKCSPLEICIKQTDNAPYWEEAFILSVPHTGCLRTLSIAGSPAEVLPVLTEHFSCTVPLLHNLRINLIDNQAHVLPDNLFNGDLSSLRELALAGLITPLPWRGLLNLTSFNLCHVPEDKILLTQLLDFFESSPRLHHILLHDSIPNSSDSPPGRVVSLPHLEELSITAQPPHSILLNHLSIPAGASLCLEFTFSGKESPVPLYLPNSCDNPNNLSHITATNLHFGSDQRSARLSGPSGELYILGNWTCGVDSPTAGTSRFLRSLLNKFNISRIQRLAISLYSLSPRNPARIETSDVYKTLRPLEDLRTLTLARCGNHPFISALDPDSTPENIVLCPKLEEIILYIERSDRLYVEQLMSMAEERALRGAKLPAITIVSTESLAPTKEVFQLRKHVSRVEYKFDDAPPAWDTLPVT